MFILLWDCLPTLGLHHSFFLDPIPKEWLGYHLCLSSRCLVVLPASPFASCCGNAASRSGSKCCPLVVVESDVKLSMCHTVQQAEWCASVKFFVIPLKFIPGWLKMLLLLPLKINTETSKREEQTFALSPSTLNRTLIGEDVKLSSSGTFRLAATLPVYVEVTDL